MAYVLNRFPKQFLWQTIQTKEVRLTAGALVSNLTSRPISVEKEKMKESDLLPVLLKNARLQKAEVARGDKSKIMKTCAPGAGFFMD